MKDEIKEFQSEASTGLVVMNREGTVLKLTIICDLSKVFMEFKLCIERNGHGAIMQHDADSKPIRPDAAFQRRNNGNQWNQEHMYAAMYAE